MTVVVGTVVTVMLVVVGDGTFAQSDGASALVAMNRPASWRLLVAPSKSAQFRRARVVMRMRPAPGGPASASPTARAETLMRLPCFSCIDFTAVGPGAALELLYVC